MCIAPVKLADGQEVACHNCWQCAEHRILDWEGRCIAEGATAAASFALTLTYGRDSMGEKLHERAVVLTYSDFQKYIKLLRRHGYVVRYFVAGEFGSKKGRAHWHPILFFYQREDGEAPYPPICGWNERGEWLSDAFSRGEREIRFNHVRVDERGKPVYVDGKPAWWWSHGFSFWKPVHTGSVRYACSYVLKDLRDAEAQGHLAMSKKPPLGAEYFRRIAERYVANGLAPQSLEYRMDEARAASGAPLQFMLGGRSAELFLEHYVATWERTYPGRALPTSEMVTNWLDYGTPRVPELAARWREFLDRRTPPGGWRPPPGRKPKRWETDWKNFDQRMQALDEAREAERALREKEQKRNGEIEREKEEREKSITKPYEWRGASQLRPYAGGRRVEPVKRRKPRRKKRG